jgi:transposase
MKLRFYQLLELYYDCQRYDLSLRQLSRKYNVSQPTINNYRKQAREGVLTLRTIQQKFNKDGKLTSLQVARKQVKFGELRKPENQKYRNTEVRLSPNYGKGKVNNLPRKVESRILELVQHGKRSFEIVSLINLEFDYVALSRSDLYSYLKKRA